MSGNKHQVGYYHCAIAFRCLKRTCRRNRVAAIAHRLQKGIISGYGYTAIIIAYMSQLNPIVALLVAILMAGYCWSVMISCK